MNAASHRHGPSHRLGLDLASLTSACPTAALRVGSRRWFLQAGMAGLGAVAAGAGAGGFGSTLGEAAEAVATRPQGDRKAVILFWLSGGPSHIDMWDPKPDAPSEIRGPFATIPTKIPGVMFSDRAWPRRAP